MDVGARLEDLKNVCSRLSVEIEEADLSHDEVRIESGYCRAHGRDLIILDKNLASEQQVEVFLQELPRFDLEPIYVPDWIRWELEKRATG